MTGDKAVTIMTDRSMFSLSLAWLSSVPSWIGFLRPAEPRAPVE